MSSALMWFLLVAESWMTCPFNASTRGLSPVYVFALPRATRHPAAGILALHFWRDGNSVSVLSWRTSACARYTGNVPDGLLFSFQCSTPFRGREVFCLSLLKGTFWALLKKFFENFFIFFCSRIKKGKKITPPWVVSATKWILIQWLYIYCFFCGFDV